MKHIQKILAVLCTLTLIAGCMAFASVAEGVKLDVVHTISVGDSMSSGKIGADKTTTIRLTVPSAGKIHLLAEGKKLKVSVAKESEYAENPDNIVKSGKADADGMLHLSWKAKKAEYLLILSGPADASFSLKVLTNSAYLALTEEKDAEPAMEEEQPGEDEAEPEAPAAEEKEPEQKEPAQGEPEENEPEQPAKEDAEKAEPAAEEKEPEQNEPVQDEPKQEEPGQDEPEQPAEDKTEPAAPATEEKEPEQKEPAQDEPAVNEPEQPAEGETEPAAPAAEEKEPEQNEPAQDQPEENEPEQPAEGETEPEAPASEEQEPEENEPAQDQPEVNEPEQPAEGEIEPAAPAVEEKEPEEPAEGDEEPEVPEEEQEPEEPLAGEGEPETPAEEEQEPEENEPEQEEPAEPAEGEEEPESPAEEEEEPEENEPEQEPEDEEDPSGGVEIVITKTLQPGQSWNGTLKRKTPTVLKLDVSSAEPVHMLVEGKNIWASVRKADSEADDAPKELTDPETNRVMVSWNAETGSYLITLGPNEGSLLARVNVTVMTQAAFDTWEAENYPEEEEPGEEPLEEEEPEEEEPEEEEPEENNRSITVNVTWDVPNPVIGDTAHFHAALEGYENLTYTMQWQYSPDREDWIDLPGETAQDMDVVVTPENNVVYWRIVVYVEDQEA